MGVSYFGGLGNVWDRMFQDAAENRKTHQQDIADNVHGAGGHFSIDPAQAKQVIAACHAALDRLTEIRQYTTYMVSGIHAPGSDSVSENAVKQIGNMVGGADGSFMKALDAYQKKIENTIDGLEENLKQYGIADDNAVQALKVDWKS
jgi:hypothetical protein